MGIFDGDEETTLQERLERLGPASNDDDQRYLDLLREQNAIERQLLAMWATRKQAYQLTTWHAAAERRRAEEAERMCYCQIGRCSRLRGPEAQWCDEHQCRYMIEGVRRCLMSQAKSSDALCTTHQLIVARRESARSAAQDGHHTPERGAGGRFTGS